VAGEGLGVAGEGGVVGLGAGLKERIRGEEGEGGQKQGDLGEASASRLLFFVF
jgi:hypothetical protein